MEKASKLYIVMNGDNYERELYEINDVQSYIDREESSIASLGEPLLRMTESTFPESMNFGAIDSRIYMVGGSMMVGSDDSCKYLTSNKVFIYDTVSSTLVSGPPMNAAKHFPYLITLGSKLFALSKLLDSWNNLEGNPRFEMLDTENLGRGWSPLPKSPFDLHKAKYNKSRYGDEECEFACAATNGFIFGSLGHFGTWAFDLKKFKWNQVSLDLLPFCGLAVPLPMPNLPPNLCCAYSKHRDRHCVFRFCYQTDTKDFEIIEIPIDDSYTLTPLMPSLVCARGLPIVFGSDGRVYFVSGGVDEAESYNSAAGNRYVKVYALHMNPIETNKIDSVLRRCSHRLDKPKKKKQKLMRFQEINKDDDEGMKEIKLNGLWSRSFFGGPAHNSYVQVVAAFAI